MESKLEFGTLLDGMRETLVPATGAASVFVIAMTALGTGLDMYFGDSISGGYFFLSSIVSLVAGYLLLRALVLQNGIAEDDAVAGFGSYFGLSFLQGLAVILGLILLVVPGVILMVRWIPSFALLLSERCSVDEAMKRSWGATRGNFWVLFGVALLGAVVPLGILVVFFTTVASMSPEGGDLLVEAVVSNLLLSAMSGYFALLGVAAYRQLFFPQRELDEVFA